ncbi:hypothetical protein [Leisingera sp. ANG-M7]|uniref:hypothetical protein n=1 Tax=Leisingera sp. ANG-M7 TaxID=1577902 RepID=UPI00057ECDCE|nr:hypothetical protein [Leisingera sp. ANG-M7]KIC36531.1 hypothetical protein RA26_12405 [Leisingera sp. ANG-M7]
MTSPHLSPETHGTTFGKITVTVDVERGDCIIHAPGKGLVGQEVPTRKRFNSLDEIRGAYGIQLQLARTAPGKHPNARDMARALEFAGKALNDHQEAKRQ